MHFYSDFLFPILGAYFVLVSPTLFNIANIIRIMMIVFFNMSHNAIVPVRPHID